MRTSFDTFNLKRNCKGNSSHSEYDILFIKSPLGKNKCRKVITLTWCQGKQLVTRETTIIMINL